MKNKKLLLSLILALFLGGFVGSLFGDNMKVAIDAKDFYLEAKTELRNLNSEFMVSALTNDEKDILKETIHNQIQIEAGAEENYKKHSFYYYFFRLSDFVGHLFLNMLNLLVIPLIMASIITGMAFLGDIRHVGRTGLRTITYYMATTAIAVIIGITLVTIIGPGEGIEVTTEIASKIEGKQDKTIFDTILNVFINEDNSAKGMFPSNIFKAMSEKNVLGVIVFSLLLGGALTAIGNKGKAVLDFFDGLNEAILKLIHLVLYLLPLGIFGLIVSRLAKAGGGDALLTELAAIGMYALTVVAALLIHALIIIPLVLKTFTDKSPIEYAKGMTQALLTAFSTASSSATLPTTMECAEKNNGISKKSTSFVLPLGATINMDGTALYEAVAVIFIAQAYGIGLAGTTLLIIFLTATLAAVGAAGIPEAGLVTMVLVLNATGLPVEGITLLLAIDWLLDRCRTTVNVWGDSVGCAVVDHYEETKEA